MDPVVHFEMPYDDAARMMKFYKAAFGWKMKGMGEKMGNYVLATTSANGPDGRPKEPGAINGGLMRRTKDTPAPVVTIGVDAIDDSLKKVEAGGGSTITPRTEIPNMGAFAYFKDSEGNVVGLWETMG